MARRSGWFVAIALLAVAGAAAYVMRDRWLGLLGAGQGPDQAATAQQSGRAAGGRQAGGSRRGRFAGAGGPVPVLVATADRADVPVTVDGVGTAQPLATVVVRSRVDGELVKVLFKEGQDVKAGDLLAQVDDVPYQAALDQALAKEQQDQATLANAQRDLDRYIGLAQSNAVTRQQVDSQRATVAQTQAMIKSDAAAIESARASLSYTQITSPIDGRTGIRGVDAGNIVHASDTTGIVTVSQIQPIAVLFSVPQQSLAAVNRAAARGAAPVEALSDDGTHSVDHGTLTVVDNQVDSTTGTVRLKAAFPNADLSLWPGAFVTARLRVDTLAAVTTVPTAAVQRGPDGAYVYRVEAGEGGDAVHQQPVTVGHQDDVRTVISTGVSAGDRVVTTGFARLQDGSKVQVSQAGQDGPGAQGQATSSGSARHGSGRGAGQDQRQDQGQAGGQSARHHRTGAAAPNAGGSASAASAGTAGPGAVNPASP